MGKEIIFKNGNQFEYAAQTKGFMVSFRPSGFTWHNHLSTVCNHGLGMLLISRTALIFFYAFVFCKEKLNHDYKNMLFLGLIFVNAFYKIIIYSDLQN